MLQNSRDLFRLVFPAPQHFQHTGGNSINVCWMIELNGKLSWWQIMIWRSCPSAYNCAFLPTAKPQEPFVSFSPGLIASQAPSWFTHSVSRPRAALFHSRSGPASCPAPFQPELSEFSHGSKLELWNLPELGLNPDIWSSLAVAEWNAWSLWLCPNSSLQFFHGLQA